MRRSTIGLNATVLIRPKCNPPSLTCPAGQYHGPRWPAVSEIRGRTDGTVVPMALATASGVRNCPLAPRQCQAIRPFRRMGQELELYAQATASL